nr:hypothetical protein CFP56_04307 [Quercus suber]
MALAVGDLAGTKAYVSFFPLPHHTLSSLGPFLLTSLIVAHLMSGWAKLPGSTASVGGLLGGQRSKLEARRTLPRSVRTSDLAWQLSTAAARIALPSITAPRCSHRLPSFTVGIMAVEGMLAGWLVGAPPFHEWPIQYHEYIPYAVEHHSTRGCICEIRHGAKVQKQPQLQDNDDGESSRPCTIDRWMSRREPGDGSRAGRISKRGSVTEAAGEYQRL